MIFLTFWDVDMNNKLANIHNCSVVTETYNMAQLGSDAGEFLLNLKQV